ncbi:hypothetical protein ACVW0J_003725 [Bradyrhizobium sp. i1.7.7]
MPPFWSPTRSTTVSAANEAAAVDKVMAAANSDAASRRVMEWSSKLMLIWPVLLLCSRRVSERCSETIKSMTARCAVNEMAIRIADASGNDVSAQRRFRERTACAAGDAQE